MPELKSKPRKRKLRRFFMSWRTDRHFPSTRQSNSISKDSNCVIFCKHLTMAVVSFTIAS
eukprot:scaffold199096_cov20-Cyclotella_meneghiniana.AAC.1